ncbi:MAG: hypothetical protein IKV88_00920 [Clostridia bacterium]|nr:hypothetical protein [Clostridia bacterium]
MSKKGWVIFLAILALIWYYNSDDTPSTYQYNNTPSINNGYQGATTGGGGSGYTPQKKTCTSCYGSGACKSCGGSGKFDYESRTAGSWCRGCSGTGNCTTCKGKGYYMS